MFGLPNINLRNFAPVPASDFTAQLAPFYPRVAPLAPAPLTPAPVLPAAAPVLPAPYFDYFNF